MLAGGSYVVEVCDRGGFPVIGVLETPSMLRWERVRDDISGCEITLHSVTADMIRLMRLVKSGRSEIRLRRNGRVVWEGPITRKYIGRDRIELSARDVLWYASRRVLETGYDFSGGAVNAVEFMETVLRSIFASTEGDPERYNVLVSPIFSLDDARTLASIPPYSRRVWELLDSYADDGGIDYTVVGRRIVLWDTHCRVAETVGLTDADFSDSLAIIEYGSDLRTRQWFTSNDGNATYSEAPQEWLDYYGRVDGLSSNIEEGVTPITDPAEWDQIVAEKSERVLSGGYPAPVWVKVPENVGLNQDAPLDINQLIPGTHIPVETTLTHERLRQVQKLDKVSVVYTSAGEQFLVSMSPRPATVTERAVQAGVAAARGVALAAERYVPVTLAPAGVAAATGTSNTAGVTSATKAVPAFASGAARQPEVDPPPPELTVLHRVGPRAGASVPSVDDEMDWSAASGYVSGGSEFDGAGPTSGFDPSVNTDTTPYDLFEWERYGTQTWTFAVQAGLTVEVRLYTIETWASGAGQRTFNVTIEGSAWLTNYDIYADVGRYVGVMKSTQVVSDGSISVVLTNVVNNANVCGFEIVTYQ